MTPISGKSERLWACHAHQMIGNEHEARVHAVAHDCEPEQLDQETSDAVRDEWAKARADRIAAFMAMARRVDHDVEPTGGGPFGF